MTLSVREASADWAAPSLPLASLPAAAAAVTSAPAQAHSPSPFPSLLCVLCLSSLFYHSDKKWCEFISITVSWLLVVATATPTSRQQQQQCGAHHLYCWHAAARPCRGAAGRGTWPCDTRLIRIQVSTAKLFLFFLPRWLKMIDGLAWPRCSTLKWPKKEPEIKSL